MELNQKMLLWQLIMQKNKERNKKEPPVFLVKGIGWGWIMISTPHRTFFLT